MRREPLFTMREYMVKAFYTFCPRFILSFSPWKTSERNHWASQNAGDTHGFDKYSRHDKRIDYLIQELERIIKKEDSILDLGCNCGLYMHQIRSAGFERVSGVDISRNAIEFGRKEFGFSDQELIVGSFDEVLPDMYRKGQRFSITYSMGATLELVHPSFDIIRSICDVTDTYVLLIISEWDHRYPRFWEFEFNRQGFLLVKCLRPFDGGVPEGDPSKIISFLLFRRIKKPDCT